MAEHDKWREWALLMIQAWTGVDCRGFSDHRLRLRMNGVMLTALGSPLDVRVEAAVGAHKHFVKCGLRDETRSPANEVHEHNQKCADIIAFRHMIKHHPTYLCDSQALKNVADSLLTEVRQSDKKLFGHMDVDDV